MSDYNQFKNTYINYEEMMNTQFYVVPKTTRSCSEKKTMSKKFIPIFRFFLTNKQFLYKQIFWGKETPNLCERFFSRNSHGGMSFCKKLQNLLKQLHVLCTRIWNSNFCRSLPRVIFYHIRWLHPVRITTYFILKDDCRAEIETETWESTSNINF